MKKLLAFAAVVLLMTGCQMKTATYADDQAIPLEEGQADSLILSVSLEYPVKGASAEAVEKMSQSILAAAFDLEEEPGTVEETARRYEDNLKDGYFNEYENVKEVGIRSWEDRVNGYFSGKYGPFVSYMVEYYGFRGGAHGIATMTPVVFDGKTGELVPEEAFFVEGYRAPVAALIRSHLLESLEGDEDALATIFEPDLVGPNGNYEVTKDGVTWYYQPYDIAPFDLGVISVSVPWKELKPYVLK
jgi:hypothetical protein